MATDTIVGGVCRARRRRPRRPADERSGARKSAGPPSAVLIPLGALVVSLLLFGVFVAFAGVNPLDVYSYMVLGSFGTWFSVQNTLTLASPLILTALCTALPAQAGLMVIGGEGAFVIGGLAAIAAGLPVANVAPPLIVQLVHGRRPAWRRARPGSPLPARCATGAASTRPSRRCCSPISASPSSITWSKA